MRTSTSAVHFAAAGQEATMEAARRIAALTHDDPRLGKAPRSSTNSSASRSRTPTPSPRSRTFWLLSTPTTAAATPPSSRLTGTPIRLPSSTVLSGPAWAPLSGPCAPPPASKTRYARRSISAVTRTPSPRVTGSLAGPYYGLVAIPARWPQPLHVPLPGFDGRVLYLAALLHLAHRLGEGLLMRKLRNGELVVWENDRGL